MARIAVMDGTGRLVSTVEAVLGRKHTVVRVEGPEGLSGADLLIIEGGRHGPEQAHGLSQSIPTLLVAEAGAGLVPSAEEKGRLETIGKPFDPFELSMRVDNLLKAAASPPAEAMVRQRDRGWLEFPYVPVPAGAMLRRAVRLEAPLWILGEPGSGRQRIAAAVCRLGEHARPLVSWFPDQQLEAVVAAHRGAPFALLVPEVEELEILDQERLAAVVFATPECRLVATSRQDPADRVTRGEFSRRLYYALSGLAIQVSPLRERSLAITPLVELIAGRIVAELGGSEVSFTPEALARLQTYMWPGNIVELESVLNRSLASLGSIEPSLLVDTNDLLFTADGAGTASRRPRPSVAPTAQLRPQSQPSAGFENLIAGLAHDLRNPITSIKTFADLISSGSATPEDAATLGRVAAADCLTLSSRIEVLQEFGGLGQPLPKNLDLMVSAAEVVAACDQFQRVQLRAEGPLLLCCDREQLRFVLTNLLAATLDECATDGAVVVIVEDGSLCFKVEAGRRPIAALRRLANAGDENISWRIALAGAVATRNGGSVKLGFEGETMTVTLGLPRARSEEESSGKQANRTDS